MPVKVTNNEVLNIIRKSDPDYDPTKIIQVGYNVIDVTMVTELLQSAAGIGTFDNSALLDDATHYETVSADNSDFPVSFGDTGDVGNDRYKMDILTKMVYQAWTAIRSITEGGDYLTMDTSVGDPDNEKPMFRVCYEAFKDGIDNEPLTWYNKDEFNTEITDLSDAVEGISEGDDALVGDENHHTGWFRRVFYALGVAMRKDFPELSTRIENTNNSTVYTRNIEALFFLSVVNLFYYYVISYMQSDVAMFCLAGLIDSQISMRIPKEIFNAVDPFWLHFAQEHKYDAIGANITGHRAYTSNFIGHTLIEATSLDTAILNWKTKFIVSDWALKRARQHWGVGKYDRGGSVVYFLNLLNGMIPSTGYTTHGVTTWELGINLAGGIDALQRIKDLPRDFLKYVHHKSYTWSEVNNIYNKNFSEFSVLGSLKGFADPDTYKPLNRQFGFEDNPDDTTHFRDLAYTCDPQALLTGDAFTVGSNTIAFGSEWAYLFFPDSIPDHYRLYFPYDWNEPEIYNALWFGLLFDVTDSPTSNVLQAAIDAGLYYYGVRKLRLVEIIDAKDHNKVYCLAASYQTQTPKWNDINDVLDYSNYPETAIKFASELIDVVPAVRRVYCSHRPKGWDGVKEVYIGAFGHADVAKQLIENMVGYTSSGKSTSAPKPQVESKEVDTKTEGDNADGTEA